MLFASPPTGKVRSGRGWPSSSSYLARFHSHYHRDSLSSRAEGDDPLVVGSDGVRSGVVGAAAGLVAMNGRRLTIAVAVLACLPLLYLAMYFIVARRGGGIGGGGLMCWTATYWPLPDQPGRALFQPLHRLDRNWLRPDYWNEPRPYKLGIGLHDR
jgi:hypothetical protein